MQQDSAHSPLSSTRLRIAYEDGRGLLRTILIAGTQLRFAVDQVALERVSILPEEAQYQADLEGITAG